MANVKLEKRASLEFTLFERFAEFLAELEFPNDNKLRVGKFHDFFASSLLGGNMTAESVRNILIKTGKYAEIHQDRFMHFCEKFQSTFQSLPTEQKKIYQEMNEAFIQWRDKLFQKNGFELQVEDVDKKSMTSNETINLSIDDLKDKIEKVTDIISKDYNSLHDDQYFYEAWAFQEWRRSMRFRESFEPKSGISKFMENIFKQFSEGGLDIFTIQDGKIIKKQIFFAVVKYDQKHQVTGHFHSDDSLNISFGKFLYNFEDELLILGGDSLHQSSNWAREAFVFKVSREDIYLYTGSRPLKLCNGFSISSNDCKRR